MSTRRPSPDRPSRPPASRPDRPSRRTRGLLPLGALALGVAATPSAGASDLWLVDGSGFGDFTDLQTAVDVAQDGDVLLVRAGVYDGFTVTHEGLTIVAHEPGSVIVLDGVRVEDTLLHHEVVLSGLDLRGRNEVVAFAADQAPALDLWLTRGPVRVERCALRGADGHFFQCHPQFLQCCTCMGYSAVHAELALDLSFHDCLLAGGVGTSWLDGHEQNRGGDALRVRGGTVSLFDCEVRGERGGTSTSIDFLYQGGDGGHGLRVEEHPLAPRTRVFVSGGEVVGGDGMIGDPCLEPCGNGGDAVRADGPEVLVRLQDVPLIPGADGCPQCGWPFNGVPGMVENELNGAEVRGIFGAARALDTPLRAESGLVPLTYRGEPGDLVFAQASPWAEQRYAPALRGVRLLTTDLPSAVTLLGQADATGTLSAPLALPGLPLGFAPGPVHVQALVRDTQGRAWLAAGATVVVLD